MCMQDRASSGDPRNGAQEHGPNERKCRRWRDIEVDHVCPPRLPQRLAHMVQGQTKVSDRRRARADVLACGGVQVVEPNPVAQPRIIEHVAHEGRDPARRRRALTDDQHAKRARVSRGYPVRVSPGARAIRFIHHGLPSPGRERPNWSFATTVLSGSVRIPRLP
jgi:hypothetical protein